jgi:hypothetical protein
MSYEQPDGYIVYLNGTPIGTWKTVSEANTNGMMRIQQIYCGKDIRGWLYEVRDTKYNNLVNQQTM